MIIVKPKTQAVSMTGCCKLLCVHCQGYFIEGMQDEIKEDCDSYLISGGCDENGCIPFDFDLMKDMKKLGKKINVHSGLVDEETAKEIGKYADVVSFDFVTDDKVIKDIYHLNRTEQDYINSYKWLKKYCRVVPHILIGFGNEMRSIKKLRELGEHEVTFIILTRHPQIQNDLKEPTLEEIEKVLKEGRKFELVHLGCMRPIARKKEIDQMALKYVDSIVNPSKDADFSGIDIIEKDMCCSI